MCGAATAVSRTASIYAPEIVGSAGFAADFFKDAAVSVDYQEILKDAGILAGSDIVLKTAYDQVKNRYDAFDDTDRKKLKKGVALGAVGAAILSSGCIGPGESSDSSYTYTPPREVAESRYAPEPVATNYEPVETPTVEATPEPVYVPQGHAVKADENLFGTDIGGVKGPERESGGYNVFNEEGERIFEHSEHSASYDKRLALDLQPEQYRALTSEYGTPRNIIFERYDTTGNGELDTVAIRYEGTKETLEFERDVVDNAGLNNYLKMYLYKK
ncbi:MAG: hypothetical protein J7J06_05175 [Methanosarcinales archaeon]|nr:hypothetical protein [Methanosarcinales archaeon]